LSSRFFATAAYVVFIVPALSIYAMIYLQDIRDYTAYTVMGKLFKFVFEEGQVSIMMRAVLKSISGDNFFLPESGIT
jgi:hypothetical protein